MTTLRKYGPNTEIAADRDGRGRFASGNAGKPAGARHRSTLAVEALLAGEAEALTRRAVEAALEGDIGALKLCLDRIAPPRRDAPVSLALPPMRSAADAAAAMAAVLEAVAGGAITPSEGERLAGLVDIFRKTLETADLEARVAALEAAGGSKR